MGHVTAVSIVPCSAEAGRAATEEPELLLQTLTRVKSSPQLAELLFSSFFSTSWPLFPRLSRPRALDTLQTTRLLSKAHDQFGIVTPHG